ncbi:cellulose biosynthesis cyclic di-GMP-binding regulatory protein BcsB [Luteimonas sp. BDR2-5]|uniref:cellulose biosynthesis cyclic di-GMP-binding regulatory protein BcsB n=1 Tax=Proluteimonas luteida TaxID=2878685 RepID=UPI001E4C44C7|nr:cellulose biosynthesis cyclic di-GMP-binding regulatory protein BcsB [Luteimonas sp. BDR2-5]MCD9027074.1 cellulose biosynthesis cyclic di-GMP-binding regulatory protein BcsB [Luteimonas sp. BDR2-5]
MKCQFSGGRARSHTCLLMAAACAVTVLFGAAHAQDQEAAEATAPAESTPEAPPVAQRERRSTLRDLGIDYEITLRGIQGTAGIPFSVRTDQMVDRAALHLKYSYSPALLPDLSHLRVTVNDVTVATLPVPAGDAGRVLERRIDIDPRLVIDYNRINLQLIGHYTRDCEDPDHTSLWANIDSSSYLELGWQPLALADDLSLLPVPFFDARDVRPLDLAFVFADTPEASLLESAGILSSWFGALAGYRGARFPASFNQLPLEGNAVVVASARKPPQGIALSEVAGPTLAVVPNPNDPYGKLLLVSGRDDAEVRIAAMALALGTPLTGGVATIDGFTEAAPRQPYDAPNWISSTRPVRFSELVAQPDALNVSGYRPDLIRVGLQLPPDLFIWRRDGIPLKLAYRYTLPGNDDGSGLNISINDAFVTTLPLDGRPYAQAPAMRWLHSLGPRGGMPIRQNLLLPTGPFSANSQLRFHFHFDRPQAEACTSTFADVSGAIDGDSSIDLSGFHHYMAMPNLAAFGNAGFPFTRLADLAETALVLPESPVDMDIGNALTLLGRMGASTGYPALRTRIIAPRQVDEFAGHDLLVIGSRHNQPLFTRWADALPIGDDGGRWRFRLSDWLLGRVPGFLSPDAGRTDLPTTAEVVVQPAPGDVVLMGFESPLQASRSVVAILADEPSRVGALFEAWSDPARLRDFQGSVVLLEGEKVRSLAGNQTYHVGHLPPLVRARWFFANNPLWLALAVAAGCGLLALVLGWLLRRQAAIREREAD